MNLPMSNPAPAAVAESKSAPTRPDLQSRKAQRLQELSASALNNPDAKQAVLNAAGAEALKLLYLVMNAVRQAAMQIADPAERLKQLRAAASTVGNLAKIGEKLS